MPKTLNQKRSRSAHPNTNTRPKSRKSKAARCAINVLISLEQDVRSTTNAERCEINVLTVPTCAPERQPNLKRRTRAAKPDLKRRQGNRKLLTINRRRKATARGWMESDGHCSIIMSPDAKDIGVGYFMDENTLYLHWWTLNVGTVF